MRIITPEEFEAQYRLQKGLVELAEVSTQEYLDYCPMWPAITATVKKSLDERAREDMKAKLKKTLAYRARPRGGNLLVDLNTEVEIGDGVTKGYGSAKVYFAPELLGGETASAEFIEKDRLSRLEEKVNFARLGVIEDRRRVFISLAYYIDINDGIDDNFLTATINLTKKGTNIGADYMLVTSQESSQDIVGITATAYKIAGPKQVSEGDKNLFQ
ncbi:hypothetical protein HY494_02545 [Candidatus Woesearchaeota archaeon]|nr:hypothetical protein [Candidatus Woesearchaeota archaeon]